MDGAELGPSRGLLEVAVAVEEEEMLAVGFVTAMPVPVQLNARRKGSPTKGPLADRSMTTSSSSGTANAEAMSTSVRDSEETRLVSFSLAERRRSSSFLLAISRDEILACCDVPRA